jgi:hypothetical protein
MTPSSQQRLEAQIREILFACHANDLSYTEFAKEITNHVYPLLEAQSAALGRARDVLGTFRDAWFNEGPNPEYHQGQQERLKKEWPTLYKALVEADKVYVKLASLPPV